MTDPAQARTAAGRLVTFLETEVPYWGDMEGQEHRWQEYNRLIREVKVAEAAASEPLDVLTNRLTDIAHAVDNKHRDKGWGKPTAGEYAEAIAAVLARLAASASEGDTDG